MGMTSLHPLRAALEVSHCSTNYPPEGLLTEFIAVISHAFDGCRHNNAFEWLQMFDTWGNTDTNYSTTNRQIDGDKGSDKHTDRVRVRAVWTAYKYFNTMHHVI